MELLFVIFVGIFVIIIIELSIRRIVLFVNGKFQWLITNRDDNPRLPDALSKFLKYGYDSELGWVRKPNTEHSEIGKYGKTKWTINARGCRTNPNYENKDSLISCYGDSFTFARQVNDNETWEHYLSQILETNVLNFGVGNYGIDQSILRLKREYSKNKTPIVILSIVPETITRINSIWKHYYEYGNTLGFKPKFIIKNDKLELIKNFIDTEQKFYEYSKFLPEIKKHDFFYKKKFEKEKIYFPYTLTILKNFSRNSKIIFWILLTIMIKKLIQRNSRFEWKAMKIIMKINLSWRVRLFQIAEHKKLLKKIIEDYVEFARLENFKPILIFLPQKDDIIYIKKNFHYYVDFLKDLEKIKGLYHIDVINDFLREENLDEIYSDNNEYGGHFSREGNKKVAMIINREIKNKLLL